MKVLAMVPYPLDSAPGQRYRFEQWAPYLAEENIEISFVPFATGELARLLQQRGRYFSKSWEMIKGLGRRFRTTASADQYDAVLVQREACLVGPAWAERCARRRQPRFVYDFDDAVYLRYVSPTNRYLSYLKFPSKTQALCRFASLVLAGNTTLAEYARSFNTDVHVVPSTVSLRDYRLCPTSRRPGPPVIGWTGSHSSAQYLQIVEDALRSLASRWHFRFLAVGVEGLTIPGLEVINRPWNPATEAEDLWNMDVGIMPLPDEPWTRGKCGMKAIQYMGVGLPVVASPVGANREIVRDRVDGFLPKTPPEWVEALSRLLADPALRRTMGAAGRANVEARYSAEVQAPRVGALLRALAAQPLS